MSHPRQADRVDRGTNRASLLSARSRSVDSVDNRNDIREFLFRGGRRPPRSKQDYRLTATSVVSPACDAKAAMLAGISVDTARD